MNAILILDLLDVEAIQIQIISKYHEECDMSSHVCSTSHSLVKQTSKTEIALSMAEIEYIIMSEAIREVLSLIDLMKEVNRIISFYLPNLKIICKVFQDSSICISITKVEKFTHRTKHILQSNIIIVDHACKTK